MIMMITIHDCPRNSTNHSSYLGNFPWFLRQDYGPAGVLRGATDSFFGFLGFDAVCALATETKDAPSCGDGPRDLMDG
jgi:amino acid transporter